MNLKIAVRILPVSLLLILVINSGFVKSAPAPAAAHTLIVFEGSDWCRNCIRFKKTVLTKESFQKYLEKRNIEVEQIDFPQRKQLDAATVAYNSKIADKYNFDGVFPTLLLINNTTEAVAKIPYATQDVYQFMLLMDTKLSEIP